MNRDQPAVTILIHRDGAPESRKVRIPIWALRVLLGVGIGLTGAAILGLALYLPLVRTAARVPGLTRQVDRLEAENAKIREVVAALDTAESRYAQVRQMMGGNLVPDPYSLSYTLPVAPPIRAHAPGQSIRYESGASLPGHWPLEDPGYMTRGQIGTGTRDEAHPGLDIAIPTGTVVRATGGGSVVQVATDSEYGNFVLLAHPEGYQSLYGHLSRIVVAVGGFIHAGEVLGLSGNTGRSSAPHLHFEIRREGKSLDPLTMVQEGR